MVGFSSLSTIVGILFIVQTVKCRIEQEGTYLCALNMIIISEIFIYYKLTYIFEAIVILHLFLGSTMNDENEAIDRNAKLCKFSRLSSQI